LRVVDRRESVDRLRQYCNRRQQNITSLPSTGDRRQTDRVAPPTRGCLFFWLFLLAITLSTLVLLHPLVTLLTETKSGLLNDK